MNPSILKCGKCNREYHTRSGLAKHLKTCQTRDPHTCQFCGMTFNTFQGTRLHETKVHAVSIAEQSDKVAETNSEVANLILMAKIEATLPKNAPVLKILAEKTGLTKHQVRHRREKPSYKALLSQEKQQGLNIQTSANSTAIPPHAEQSSTLEDPSGNTTTICSYSLRSRNIAATVSERPLTPALPNPLCTGESITTTSPSRAQKHQPLTLTEDNRSKIIQQSIPTLQSIDSISGDITIAREHLNPMSPKPSTSGIQRVLQRDTIPSDDETMSQLTPEQNPPLVHKISFSTPAQKNKQTKGIPIKSAKSTSKTLAFPELHNYLQDTLLNYNGSDNTNKVVRDCVTAVSNINSRATLEEWLERYLVKLFPKAKSTDRTIKSRVNYHYGRTLAINNTRSRNFKKCQDLYAKNRHSLTTMIMEGKLDTEEANLDPATTEAFFRNLYAIPDVPTSLPDQSPCPDRPAFTPLNPEEVKSILSNLRRSAPGPDGVTLEQLKKVNTHLTSFLFNVILLANLQLKRFKTSRVVLVYKNGDKHDPANYRPISIPSLLQRTLHKILLARVQTFWKPSYHQRGFIKGLNGTWANTLILDSVIKAKRLEKKSLAIAFIDVTKAFDTVLHSELSTAINKLPGLDSITQDYLNHSIRDNSAIFHIGQTQTPLIPINRGVRQGDPLSPLLFNAVLDAYIEIANGTNNGATITPGTTISVMAFADDMVLLHDSPAHMPTMLNQLGLFLQSKGMSVNPKKCASLVFERNKSSYFTHSRPLYQVAGMPIPMVTDINAYKYLGHEVSASGVRKPTLTNLPLWLENLRKSPLKPYQKVNILKYFMIPKFIFPLQNPRITQATLKHVDLQIRSAIKTYLHLHIHTPDSCLYARTRDGGLGIPHLATLIPLSLHNSMAQLMKREDDPALTATLSLNIVRSMMERINRLQPDIPPHQTWREAIASGPQTRGLEATAEDSASRSWVDRPPRAWSGRDYVKAIHLRTFNLPTAAIPSNPPERRLCRAGCRKPETLSHVLQQCPLTHWARIRRHDTIAAKIIRHFRKTLPVEDEPHVRHPDGTLYKPDIVIHTNDDIVVCDVGVSWEGQQSLGLSWQAKKEIYNTPKFMEAAAIRWPGKTVIPLPIIIGARGVWPKANTPTAEKLKIPHYLKEECVLTALKWGPSIHAEFMRTVWRRRTYRRPIT